MGTPSPPKPSPRPQTNEAGPQYLHETPLDPAVIIPAGTNYVADGTLCVAASETTVAAIQAAGASVVTYPNMNRRYAFPDGRPIFEVLTDGP